MPLWGHKAAREHRADERDRPRHRPANPIDASVSGSTTAKSIQSPTVTPSPPPRCRADALPAPITPVPLLRVGQDTVKRPPQAFLT
jgi:hypothetical protein